MPQISHRQTENRLKSAVLLTICLCLTGYAWSTAQSATTQNQNREKRLSFAAPGAPWSLTIPAKDFMERQQQLKSDGTGIYVYLTDEQSLLNVSFFIEPALNCKDSRSCRDMVRDQGNPAWQNARNWKSSQLGDISYFEFLIPSFQGRPINQQNMYAEFVVDGYWVDLHISKVLYKPEDHQLFEDLVKAIKFERK
jgi:hypothetical protein